MLFGLSNQVLQEEHDVLVLQVLHSFTVILSSGQSVSLPIDLPLFLLELIVELL